MNVVGVASKRELLIIGAGGFGAVAARMALSMNMAAINHAAAPSWDVVGYADDDAAKRGTRHAEHVVHGTIEEAERIFRGRPLWFFCAIGDNSARARMARRAEEFGWKPATLVHPSAILDSTVKIGPGTCVGPASVISFNTKIGTHVLIDTHVSVGHDSELMDFCEVFSGARINGNCYVSEYALVGCNATVLPGTVVGCRAVVGANSLAQGLVEPDTTVFGIPARIIRRCANPLPSQEPVRAVKEGALRRT